MDGFSATHNTRMYYAKITVAVSRDVSQEGGVDGLMSKESVVVTGSRNERLLPRQSRGRGSSLLPLGAAACWRLKGIGEGNSRWGIACVGKSTLISVIPYGRSNKRRITTKVNEPM